MKLSDFSAVTLEQPCEVATLRRRLKIGLPACSDESERRFPLTPEAVAMLVERGFMVVMEAGAAATINYTDAQYADAGAEIGSRREAFGAEVVIYLAGLSRHDAGMMRPGAMLLTFLRPVASDPAAVEALLHRKVLSLALDLVTDAKGNTPFADILAEIDGRASIALASSLLADTRRGKGILLGGIAGVVPCEVTIIGSGIAAVAAARSAIGLGAMVRMFDDDVYSLRRAWMELGGGVTTSVLHPKVLAGAMRSADVVVVTCGEFHASDELVRMMKRGVVTFDLAGGKAFPTMRAVDLATVAASDPSTSLQGRLCLVNAGSAVARTAAMALSNSLLTLLDRIDASEGVNAVIRLRPEIRRSVMTFLGKPVNETVARAAGMTGVDISIFLTLS
ncbi:MAG: hypothetical protein K2K68_07785 [Duncaniella sp.]|nr:hypothetical protein [Duncaniella sp.]